MSSNTPVITEIDFDRLNTLARSPQHRSAHPGSMHALKKGLGKGRVVDPQEVPNDRVTMNSRVKIRDLHTRKTEVYTLVYPETADWEAGEVSVLAPLGAALLGSRVGDEIEVNAPSGVRTLKVEKLLYQPEAAGDFHL
jgi:regulator of nucleoside diphosphate kinase